MFIWLCWVLVGVLRIFTIFVAACGIVSCNTWDLVPLHWEDRVLATGPPGKSLFLFLFMSNDYCVTRTQKLIKLLGPNGTVRSFFWPSVQSLSHVRLFATPWTTARQASLPFTISWSLLKCMSLESGMPSNHLILCCPFSSRLQSFPASRPFPMRWHFASRGQSTGASASASVLLMNIHG